MDLFEYMRQNEAEKESPLASRMRPKTLDEVVGQQHIIGKDKLLYRAIKADKLSSVIFYGPPGTGKTTLAQVIAHTTKSEFRAINATTAGKKDMQEVVEEAKERFRTMGRKTILFIDEIHRFNKSQQDYLLPFVEDGTITLIGATTENPYFEVNGALISRSVVFELHTLTEDEVKELIQRALTDKERGMAIYKPVMDPDALDFLADMANGDARRALNALELGVLTTDPSEDGQIHLTLDVISECIQKRVIRYDREGDNHYDTISAFIKSMRGSDPDAAVYYLARMLYAGEDVKFVAPERIGMPEARIILAEAASYVASAPKSNAVVNAIDSAMKAVKTTYTEPVPNHLRDAHYGGAKKMGHGIGYQYPHDFHEHYVKQQYLPDSLLGSHFYEPGILGKEAEIKERLDHLHEAYGDSNEP